LKSKFLEKNKILKLSKEGKFFIKECTAAYKLASALSNYD
jgi:hypothetical protein